jgi:acetyltransferase-like isoleucine patch superfamily enzyme
MRLSDLRTTGFLAVVRRELRPFFGELRRIYFNKLWGMDIAPNCRISFSAKLDKSYPSGIHIGESTAINFGACVLTHDTPRGLHVDTWIGKECNIGAHSIIMPGELLA